MRRHTRTTMPSADGDVVRGLLEHWERGEFAPRLDHFDPEVELVNHVSGRRFEGYGGVRRLSATGTTPSSAGR